MEIICQDFNTFKQFHDIAIQRFRYNKKIAKITQDKIAAKKLRKFGISTKIP